MIKLLTLQLFNFLTPIHTQTNLRLVRMLKFTTATATYQTSQRLSDL